MGILDRIAASSPEEFVLGLVRRARDEDDEGLTPDQVRKDARKRRRRLGIASFVAGPLAGVAGEATDLYTETATVCDLADLHDLTLSDLEIGAHMLVLWNVADTSAEAQATLEGTGPAIADRLRVRFDEVVQETMPEKVTVIAVIKVLWKVRSLRDAATSGAFVRVLRAGAQTKEFLARAERQLGV